MSLDVGMYDSCPYSSGLELKRCQIKSEDLSSTSEWYRFCNPSTFQQLKQSVEKAKAALTASSAFTDLSPAFGVQDEKRMNVFEPQSRIEKSSSLNPLSTSPSSMGGVGKGSYHHLSTTISESLRATKPVLERIAVNVSGLLEGARRRMSNRQSPSSKNGNRDEGDRGVQRALMNARCRYFRYTRRYPYSVTRPEYNYSGNTEVG